MDILMKEKPVLLFDGMCNLCNGWVNFIIGRDPESRIRFASLQSKAGRKLLNEYNLDPEKMDTVIFLDGENVYERSDAVIHLSRYLHGAARFVSAARFIPRSVRDGIYNLIARNRYLWFGKRDSCRLPGPGDKERFLELSDDGND